jgi:hypothetical protein
MMQHVPTCMRQFGIESLEAYNFAAHGFFKGLLK